jgi:hypothetical protein
MPTTPPATAMPITAAVDRSSLAASWRITAVDASAVELAPVDALPEEDDDDCGVDTGIVHCVPVHCAVQVHAEAVGVPPLKQTTDSQNCPANGGEQVQRLVSVVFTEPLC